MRETVKNKRNKIYKKENEKQTKRKEQKRNNLKINRVIKESCFSFY